jgi:chemotaxis protein methyltransferase WspC
MKGIESLLRKTIGLDASTIGSTLVERTVRLRMKALGLATPEEYENLLNSSRVEWNELVETVLVTETWFFRDSEPFDAFTRLALEEWLVPERAASLRVLSIPCSSGEEPYSLVMALQDAGVPPGRFQIDAVDISRRALSIARRGVYGKNSFRGKELGYRNRFFHPIKGGFLLDQSVRKCVHFYQDNLLRDGFLAEKGGYDVIFCRNLLIYFDEATRQEALRKIDRLLAPGGVVFVGAAELPLVTQQGFISANIPMAFACRKPGQNLARLNGRLSPLQPSKPAAASKTSSAIGQVQPMPMAVVRVQERPPANFKVPADGSLEAARLMADAGRLKEAAEICETHLRTQCACAQAYYLLGLIRDAANDPGAADCYRKALYLEPGHYETLLQMALLAQKTGDPSRARAFRNRALRAKEKK